MLGLCATTNGMKGRVSPLREFASTYANMELSRAHGQTLSSRKTMAKMNASGAFYYLVKSSENMNSNKESHW